jgi:peptidoglycan-associated lipoprotein
MRTPLRVSYLAALLATVACGSKKPPEEPAPQPAPAPAPQPEPPPPPPPPAPAPQPTEDPAAAAARVTAAVLAEIATRVHFDFDKSDIRPEDRPILDTKASILGLNTELHLRIAGNCDERGSDEYNLALGNRRATAVKTYLMNKGIDGSRLEVVSYGEERPIAMGHDEDSWAQNRRDDFDVTAGGTNLRMP